MVLRYSYVRYYTLAEWFSACFWEGKWNSFLIVPRRLACSYNMAFLKKDQSNKIENEKEKKKEEFPLKVVTKSF